ELVRQYLSATGDPRKVITDNKPLYYGIEVNDQSLVPGAGPRLGKVHFKDWLSRTTTQKTTTEKPPAPASNLSGKAAKAVTLLVCGIVFAALSYARVPPKIHLKNPTRPPRRRRRKRR